MTQAEDDKVNVGGGSIKAAGAAPAPVFGFATTHVADSAPADSYGGGLTKSLSALQHELQAVADAAAHAPGGVEATLAVLAVSNSSGGFNAAARPPSGRKSFSPGSRSLGFGTGGAAVSHLRPSPVSGFGLAAEMAPSGLLSGARPLEALEAEETAMLFEAQVRHAAFRSPGVVSAFRVAAAAHRGRRRLDAEPVLRHCVETAVVLAELGMDSSVVATGLLHDVLDATPVTAAELRAVSGAAITGMVQGVSKLSHVSQISRDSPRALAADERQQLRAMLIAMTDARVVIVKLADRLHCLTTPQHLAPDDAVRLAQETLAQETLARETLAVYVPLASRLGIWTLKARLEDACFACLHPAEHAALSAELEDGAQRAAITVAAGAIATALAGAGITGPRAADVCGRPKSLFSVYRKMEAKGVARVAEIHDVRALRVIVTSEADCYLALAAVHARPGWAEVAGKTKDYVRHAKHNGYQSLHTVVRDEATGDVFEVQIRTVEMHRAAEYGLAAHWRYKESPAAPSPSDAPAHDAGDATFQTRASDATHKAIDEQVAWARFMLSWQGKLADNKCRAEGALDGAGTGGGGGQYAEVCSPCPCPFPTHHAQCHNHEDNLSFGGASAGCTAGMAGVLGSEGEHAAWDSFESPLVSADSASAGLFGSQTQTPLMDHWGDDSFTAAAPIFIIAVVDGVMRMLEVPRGTRLSDVDVTRGGADAGASPPAGAPAPGERARSLTVVVNREAVPPGAEVAVQLRMGDLIEVTHAPGHAGWAECAELGLQAAAAVEKQRVRLGSQFSMCVLIPENHFRPVPQNQILN